MITNGQGTAAEKNVVDSPKEVDVTGGEMPAPEIGVGAIPHLPRSIGRGDGGARDSPYRLGEPTHTRGQVWHQRLGRRELVWLLRESEEEDEMPREDYRQAPRRAAEAWCDEQEELRWQVERLPRDVELLWAYMHRNPSLRQRGQGTLTTTALEGPEEPSSSSSKVQIPLPYFLVQVEGAHAMSLPKQVPHEAEIEADPLRFEDPFQEERVRRKLQNLRQGTRSAADFTLEFRQLAGQIRDWPEPVLIHWIRRWIRRRWIQRSCSGVQWVTTPQRWWDGTGGRRKLRSV
uniref:Uncharacterized protein n=1 Tax=Sphaerodactylus townsendi TaxID=933632 RepID=A0ACB8F7K9_9SAUR